MYQPFIGRKEELDALEKLYETEGFQMMAVYGRRRIGKSTLLSHFIRGKKAIFYTAARNGLQRNLQLLSRRVLDVLAPDLNTLTFSTYEELFAFLSNKCQEERIIFIIDEFPYLAEQAPELLSILQKYIDTEWMQGNMYLILCGSSISFMEEEVLSEKSPLFGRRTAQLQVKPFSYREAADFVPSYTPAEKAVCYGITGGVAKYLSLLRDTKSLDENIVSLFFAKTGYMYEEPSNLLTQEFRNITTYNAIIEAIASGRTKQNAIADLTHLEPSTTSHAIQNLIKTGILKKEYAITDERNKRKVRYTFADHMFRFWYRFLPNGIDAIELGHGDAYYQHVVKPSISDYMGDVFEDMCRHYTLYMGLTGNLPCMITRVGKWWGTDPRKKEETDIDVVGLDTIKKEAILGECKFKNERLDKSVYEALRNRTGLIDHHYRTVQYLLFSKSGFSDWILTHQKEEAIMPIDLMQMYTSH